MSVVAPGSSSDSHDHAPSVKIKDDPPVDPSEHPLTPDHQDESIKRTSSTTTNKICFRFQNTGTCRFGSSCKFRHGDPPVNESSDIPNPSGLQKVKKPCFSFSKQGHCRFGEKCKFAHRRGNLEKTSAKGDETVNGRSENEDNYCAGSLEDGLDLKEGSGAKEKLVRNSAEELPKESRKGVVQKGTTGSDESQPSSKPTRSRVCRYYKRGSCKRGSACSFTHLGTGGGDQNAAVDAPEEDGSHPAISRAPTEGGGRRVVPRPTVGPRFQVQTFLRLAELTDADLQRLRQTEIQQLKQRFPNILEMENDDQPSIYRIVVHPTDPDWPYDLRDFHMNVCFPFGYPAEPPAISLPEDQDIPSVVLRYITSALQEWIHAKHEMNNMAGRVEILFRPFLRWFDRNIESKFTEGARELKREAEVEKSGFQFISNVRESPDVEQPPQPVLPEDAVIISKSRGQGSSVPDGLRDHELPLNSSEEEEAASEEGGAASSMTEDRWQTDNAKTSSKAKMIEFDPPDKDMRGTEIVFQGLKMAESVATLAVVRLSVIVHCARCKEPTDLTTPPHRTNLILCGKCNNRQIVAYRPCLVHPHSHVVGFLDLDGCLPFDVNLVTSMLTVGCLSCSHDNTLKGIQYGQIRNIWCEKCHQKMTLQAESCRFHRLQPAEKIASGPLFSVPVKSLKKQPKDPAIVDMQPLPENGTCKHYKKSFRWLRFPCCGKFYPCDECHDLDNAGDHEMKFATRMLCGFCAKEQPFSADKPCVRCGSWTTRGRSKHWEGGSGCRNKTRMSRNDKQKYAGINKTMSKKAQHKADSSKKGKSS